MSGRRERSSRSRLHALAGAIALVALLSFAATAQAETFNVDSTADNPDSSLSDGVCDDGSGHCTLRAAVDQLRFKNDPADRDRVNLPAATYRLTHSSADLLWDDGSDTLEVVGAGAATTTIEQTLSGTSVSRVLHATRPVELRALTVTGGDVSGVDSSGGGIDASGFLTLDRVVVKGNRAQQAGGGVLVEGGARIEDSTIGPGNQAEGIVGPADGGGIYANGATVTVARTRIIGNSGGRGSGIYFVDTEGASDLSISESTVNGNTGARFGGGIYFHSDDAAGFFRLFRSTVSGNEVSFSSPRGGGGIFLSGGELFAHHSTISGNNVRPATSSLGGGILLGGPFQGGAPSADLLNVTVAGNSAGTGSALLNESSGDAELVATIITGSCATTGAGSFTSSGYNVETGDSCGLDGPGDKPSTTPGAGPLADNGGLTLTRAIGPGSPARDIVPPGAVRCGASLFDGGIDQRGASRPSGSGCDAGAFEYQQPAPGGGVDPPSSDPPSSDPPSSGGAVDAFPSNAFRFGKLKRKKRKGIAVLKVFVPGPGRIGLRGRGIKRIPTGAARTSRFTGGGRVKLRIKPRKKGRKARKIRRRLRNKGKSKVKVRVTYVPTGGTPNTRKRKVKLVKK